MNEHVSTAMPAKTNPSGFRNPHGWGNRLGRAAWALAYLLLFRPTPFFLGMWRNRLLWCFGATVSGGRIEPSVRIWAPWMLTAGTDVYIDVNVRLYNAFGIRIGDRVVISQGAFLCTATHDYTNSRYPLVGGPITIEDDCWIAADAFIAPGVTIHRGAVVGARSVVLTDAPPWTVVAGNPAKPIKPRTLVQ